MHGLLVKFLSSLPWFVRAPEETLNPERALGRPLSPLSTPLCTSPTPHSYPRTSHSTSTHISLPPTQTHTPRCVSPGSLARRCVSGPQSSRHFLIPSVIETTPCSHIRFYCLLIFSAPSQPCPFYLFKAVDTIQWEKQSVQTGHMKGAIALGDGSRSGPLHTGHMYWAGEPHPRRLPPTSPSEVGSGMGVSSRATEGEGLSMASEVCQVEVGERCRVGTCLSKSSDLVGVYREGNRRSRRPDPETRGSELRSQRARALFTLLFPALPEECICVWAGTGRVQWVAHPPSESPSQHSS